MIFRIQIEFLSNQINSHDYVDKFLSIISKNVIVLHNIVKHEIDTTRNISTNQNRRLKNVINKIIEKLKMRFEKIEKQIDALQIKLNNDVVKNKNKRICKMHERITFIKMQYSKRNDEIVFINHHFEFSKNMKKIYALKQHAKKIFFYKNWRLKYWNETNMNLIQCKYYDNSNIALHFAICVYFKIEIVITLMLIWQFRKRLCFESFCFLIFWLNFIKR